MFDLYYIKWNFPCDDLLIHDNYSFLVYLIFQPHENDMGCSMVSQYYTCPEMQSQIKPSNVSVNINLGKWCEFWVLIAILQKLSLLQFHHRFCFQGKNSKKDKYSSCLKSQGSQRPKKSVSANVIGIHNTIFQY